MSDAKVRLINVLHANHSLKNGTGFDRLADAIEALIDERIKTALWENRLLGADEKHVKRADPEVEESLKELREDIAKLE